MIKVNDRVGFLIACEKHLNYKNPYRPIAFEIGVFNGDFSELIIAFIKPVALMLVDPFNISQECYDKGLNYLPTAYSNQENFVNVTKRFAYQIHLNLVYVWRDYSYNIIKRIAPNIDFVYHDASHLYEDLKRDLKDWLPKMEKYGLVCGHDYGNDIFPGVKQAVDEFCKEHGYEMILFNENGGDYALKRK